MKLILSKITFSSSQLFMLAMLVVNVGNYLYNLLLGRFLGPDEFADAALLITLLLVLSFIGMTFQIVVTKFVIELSEKDRQTFIKKAIYWSLLLGLLLGAIVVFSSVQLQRLFSTSSSDVFKWMGLGIPFYFLMSINRGIFQGEQNMHLLGITYITEMTARLSITFILLHFVSSFNSSLSVALAIFSSFIIGFIPIHKSIFKTIKTTNRPLPEKQILIFFMLTAFYEMTLIIINNSDILLVKSYFDNHQAGLYASLALIGRIVYFITWMFVMISLPKLIAGEKAGENTKPLLIKNLIFIALISILIIAGAFIFPELVVKILFGEAFISISSLLWRYALATALFAIANLFAYYYLSLNKYTPVMFSAIFGLIQITLIIVYHDSLEQVVHMQIIAMFSLFIVQLTFFLYKTHFHLSKT